MRAKKHHKMSDTNYPLHQEYGKSKASKENLFSVKAQDTFLYHFLDDKDSLQ